ncbi:MAG: fibronectin type III domain-containing protein [Treponema sp.]|jgi:fibronectin type 3 domain-containing protein|nr:fibronectin type III domain-containing protein [Treponema sp.]
MVYLYTNGSDIEPINYIPKYTITGSTAKYTIPFSAFKVVDGETIPGTPFGLVTTGATVSSIDLSWSSLSSNATGFRVYRSSTADGVYTQAGSPTGTTYTDTGLTANTTYYYKVSAYNGAGESPKSEFVFAVTLSNAVNSITITGAAGVGQRLTATSTGTGWASASYIWGWNEEAEGTFTHISGATGSTYTVMSAYAGRYIRAFRNHSDGEWFDVRNLSIS